MNVARPDRRVSPPEAWTATTGAGAITREAETAVKAWLAKNIRPPGA
jgi:hypothetical protein